MDACKNNVRFSLFLQRNFKSALYQGTTSVVPQKSQITRALAPAALFSVSIRARSAVQLAQGTLLLREPIAAEVRFQLVHVKSSHSAAETVPRGESRHDYESLRRG